jgi:acetolactate synthase-1/3 small subunit
MVRKPHTFVATLQDQPGVLNRVTSLFRRRAFNIVSLNVGRTHQPGISRMTVVVEADPDIARIIEANLYKLVNVLHVEDITDKAAVVRDLALIKVEVGPDRRAEVLQVCEVFRARVVDMGERSLIVEITGTQDKIDGLMSVLAPFGITEMVQSGVLAMTRGKEARTWLERTEENGDR